MGSLRILARRLRFPHGRFMFGNPFFGILFCIRADNSTMVFRQSKAPSSQIPDGATPWNSSMPHRTCPNCAKQPVLCDKPALEPSHLVAYRGASGGEDPKRS